eukprot:11967545-Alexandrium_andersonii.AAC.1
MPLRAAPPVPVAGTGGSRRPRDFGIARRGAPRFARRPRCPELRLRGLPTSAGSERGTRTSRPAGLPGAAASSIWDFAPSIS